MTIRDQRAIIATLKTQSILLIAADALVRVYALRPGVDTNQASTLTSITAILSSSWFVLLIADEIDIHLRHRAGRMTTGDHLRDVARQAAYAFVGLWLYTWAFSDDSGMGPLTWLRDWGKSAVVGFVATKLAFTLLDLCLYRLRWQRMSGTPVLAALGVIATGFVALYLTIPQIQTWANTSYPLRLSTLPPLVLVLYALSKWIADRLERILRALEAYLAVLTAVGITGFLACVASFSLAPPTVQRLLVWIVYLTIFMLSLNLARVFSDLNYPPIAYIAARFYPIAILLPLNAQLFRPIYAPLFDYTLLFVTVGGLATVTASIGMATFLSPTRR